MTVDEFNEHIKDGIDSGFDRCCIAWYFLRSHILPAVIGDRRFHKLIFWKWEHIGQSNASHILCPVCKVKYRKKMPEYYTCKKCGWRQFRNSTCTRCK